MMTGKSTTIGRRSISSLTEESPAPKHGSPFRLARRVFLLFSAIYLVTWAGHYTSGDGSYKIAWAKAMFLGRSGAGLPPAGIISRYGIGHSLLAIPPLAVAHIINKVTGIRCEPALYTLMFVVNGALFLALLAFYLAHFYPSHAVWLTVFIAGLATTWWPYTKLDFSEPLVLTTAFLGFVLMRFGYPVFGMVIAGFTLAIRTDSVAVLGPLLLWYFLSHRSVRTCLQMALAMLPTLLLVFASNYVRYHSISDHGYPGERFSNPLLVGIYGILFSSGKGIFIFSPPLLLGILGWKAFAKHSRLRPDAWLFLGVCMAQMLLYAAWWGWPGEDSWGDRFLISGVMLLCIPLVEVVHRKALVIPVVAAGVAVQLAGVLVAPLGFNLLLRSQHFEREALYVGGRNRVDFADMHFNPRYSQIVGNWILIRELLHVPPSSTIPEDTKNVGTPLYDTLPPQAWASAAHWDFVWNLRRSGSH